LLLIEKDCFKFTLKVYNNGNIMDIKASWGEIKNILCARISINPTFTSKEKEEEK